MLVMRMRHYLWMMWRVVVPKDALPLTDICIGVVDTHGMAKFRTDRFKEVEERAVSEEHSTAEESVIVI